MLLGTLTDDMEVVAIATEASAVVDVVRRYSPHLLIMEPRLPGMFAVITAIQELPNETKIVALTSQEDRDQAVKAVRLGARAYISKRINLDDLISVLRVVRSGRVVVSALAAAALLGGPEPSSGALTAQDRQLLTLIVEGLDNNEMARRLSVSESTLKRNIHQLLKKLNARNKVQAAVRAASKGLLEEM